MTDHELMEFRARCLASHTYGRQIANAAGYADMLEAEAGPVAMDGIKKHSAAHLMALVDKVLRVRAGEEPASEHKAEAKKSKKKASKKAKAEEAHEEEAPKAEVKAEEPKVEAPKEEAPKVEEAVMEEAHADDKDPAHEDW